MNLYCDKSKHVNAAGGNFGIVTEYTIKTVNVPPKVTTFDFVVSTSLY